MNGKIFQAHRMEVLILLKYPYLSNQSINLLQYLSRIATSFFTEIEKYHKICMERQKTLNSQSNFERKKKLEAPHFQISNYILSFQLLPGFYTTPDAWAPWLGDGMGWKKLEVIQLPRNKWGGKGHIFFTLHFVLKFLFYALMFSSYFLSY